MMVHKCHICNKTYSRNWNLQRHFEHHHQKGGGLGTAVDVENDEEENEEEEENISSNDNSSHGSETDDEDDDDDDDDDDEYKKENNNSVFDRFMVSFGDDDTLAERRKIFRNEFADLLVYMAALKKHPIYKKVMISAREFQDSGHDFSRVESLRLAVKQRKFLLDELVEEEHMDDESDDDDDDGDDDGLDAPHY